MTRQTQKPVVEDNAMTEHCSNGSLHGAPMVDSARPFKCGMSCQTKAQSDEDLSKHFEFVDNLPDLIRAYEAQPEKNILMRHTQMEKDDVMKVAAMLGDPFLHGAFPDVREIRFDPSNSGSIALSKDAHPPHLDGTFTKCPPTSFVLHFAISDPEGGGKSLFWSLPDMFAACPWPLLDAGFNADVRYARKRHDASVIDEVIGQMIEKDSSGRIIFRWRFDEQVQPEVVDAKGKPIFEFIEWVRKYLDEVEPISYQAKSGDTILIRQRHYLHGRSSLSSENSPRLALRTWIY